MTRGIYLLSKPQNWLIEKNDYRAMLNKNIVWLKFLFIYETLFNFKSIIHSIQYLIFVLVFYLFLPIWIIQYWRPQNIFVNISDLKLNITRIIIIYIPMHHTYCKWIFFYLQYWGFIFNDIEIYTRWYRNKASTISMIIIKLSNHERFFFFYYS